MVDGKNIVKRKSIKISRLVSMFVERRKHTNQIVNIETQYISSRIMINLVVYQIVDHITCTHTPAEEHHSLFVVDLMHVVY